MNAFSAKAIMSLDLWALLAVLILGMAHLGLASVLSLAQLGPAYILSPRDQQRDVSGVSGRIVRAYRNLLEILPQFVASLFLVHAAGANGDYTVLGAWMFFAGRLIYAPAYAFGPTGLRPIAWMAAQIGILIILTDLLV